jgi:DNA ligase (NAD+)
LGLGELVIVQSYFDENLSKLFSHPRNLIVGLCGADKINEYGIQALKDKAIHFMPYSQLPFWEGDFKSLLMNIETISKDLANKVDYRLDGMVIEITDESLKKHMGSTSHHNRWQIAWKEKGETAQTIVRNIIWQVGRTGNVTPVLQVDPTFVSGATIRRITAHHAGNILNEQIGIDSEIEIIRSGEVIPKIEKVIIRSDINNIPTNCPECDSILVWNTDSDGIRNFLKCENVFCKAKIEQQILHWFKTLGTTDWFGPKTIQKLVLTGHDSIEKIYELKTADFESIGLGPIQSKNLENGLRLTLIKEVEDWRFLAAFGVPNLGKGDSRKLLQHISLNKIFETSYDEIVDIDGFGDVTTTAILNGLTQIKSTFQYMLNKGIKLQLTLLLSETSELKSPISGKGIVFTGKMLSGSRENMEIMARKLGATVQSSVTSKTDILVVGENVGAKKTEKATKLGIRMLSEQDYLILMVSQDNSL